ncbi:MAG: hypothetical protein ACLQDY_02800 [Streptosporangiaceae bacterium]
MRKSAHQLAAGEILSGSGLTSQQREDLERARQLARWGVPLFICYFDDHGRYAGGDSWKQAKGDPAVVDRWKPGRNMGLCAVMKIFNGLDEDSYKCPGSLDKLADHLGGEMPTVYGETVTPSGGRHYLTAPLGIGSKDGFGQDKFPGLDLKGSRDGNESIGMLIIPPTEKKSKADGVVRPYRWVRFPDGPPPVGDVSGRRLAQFITDLWSKPSSDAVYDSGEPLPGFEELLAGGIPFPLPHDITITRVIRGIWGKTHDQSKIFATVRQICDITARDNPDARSDDPFTDDDLRKKITRVAAKFADELPDDARKWSKEALERDGKIRYPALDHADREAEFWDARPNLKIIRDVARERGVPPWALLGCVMARAVALTDHRLTIPGIVGTRKSLNMFAGIVGSSGQGKGNAARVAAEMVPGVAHISNAGTGEGIVRAMVRREGGELKRITDTLLVAVEEVEIITRLAERKGATLLPLLRSAWMGERIGFTNAEQARNLTVEQDSYRLTLVCAIQPEVAAVLLDDSAGGTPQRFLWLPGTDPDGPPFNPDAVLARIRNGDSEIKTLDMAAPPHIRELDTYRDLRVCDKAILEVAADHHARNSGKEAGLEGHAMLCRLKAAAAIAIISSEEPGEISDEDWDLAGILMEVSRNTRQKCIDAVQEKNARAARARHALNAEGAVLTATRVRASEEEYADQQVQRVAGVIVRKLKKDGPMKRRLLQHAAASRDRKYVDDALDLLLDEEKVTLSDDDTYHPAVADA